MTQYSKRDIAALDRAGGYYSRHVAAMTEEGLHEKSAIAAELASRDRRIALLEADAARLRNCLTDGEQPVELVRHGPDSHSGPGWYWYATEYPEEGSVGAFASRADALESILSNDSELSAQSQQALAGELDRADARIAEIEATLAERDRRIAELERKHAFVVELSDQDTCELVDARERIARLEATLEARARCYSAEVNLLRMTPAERLCAFERGDIQSLGRRSEYWLGHWFGRALLDFKETHD